MSELLRCKPAHPEPTPTNHLLKTASGSGPLSSCPHPALGTKQLGEAPMPQRPLKLFKIANSKPALLAWPVPSHGNHNKGSGSSFPHLLLPPDQHPPPQTQIQLSHSRGHYLPTLSTNTNASSCGLKTLLCPPHRVGAHCDQLTKPCLKSSSQGAPLVHRLGHLYPWFLNVWLKWTP